MSRQHHSQHSRRQVRGVTLVEAMVALLIMSFGMLALVGLQANLRRSADVAKQRSEATKLAQVSMEGTRAFGVLKKDYAPTGVAAFEDIATLSKSSIGAADSNATFAMNRTVVNSDNPPMASVDLAVQWVDRANTTESVRFTTFIAAVDPALSGSLMIPPPNGISSRRPQGRSPDIPVGAVDKGTGKSVFKPDSAGTTAWVFNNLTGQITNICSTVAPATAVADIDISACAGTKAYLLSGYVRFSIVTSTDPDPPVGPAMPFGLTLTLDAPTEYRLEEASYQCFSRLPTATTGSYHCLVYPRESTSSLPSEAAARPIDTWGGRLDLSGISLSSYKVCRYSADYDGNGSISNSEHPAVYTKVAGALTRQNFLVIRAIDTCPVGHAASPGTGVFTNTATVLHQSSP